MQMGEEEHIQHGHSLDPRLNNDKLFKEESALILLFNSSLEKYW